jgi:hypothetical protein
MTDMERQMSDLKRELIEAIKTETHEAIKHTGHSWIKEAVAEIVPVTIEATLERLGIDCKNPFECQKDMAYLRTSRQISEDRHKIFVQTAVRWLTVAGLAGLAGYISTKYGVPQ